MPLVSCLGVGGGLNHLCEVEVPEMFAESIGGLLNGGHMWLPMGQDLLSDPLLLGQARQSSGSTICRSRGIWLRQRKVIPSCVAQKTKEEGAGKNPKVDRGSFSVLLI